MALGQQQVYKDVSPLSEELQYSTVLTLFHWVLEQELSKVQIMQMTLMTWLLYLILLLGQVQFP